MIDSITLGLKCSLFLFLTVTSIASCSLTQREKEKPLARVFEKYLYPEDVIGLVTQGISAEDSAKIVETYIDNWIRQELILSKARLNLPESENNIEKEVEKYRQSRIIYAYEKELIRQKMDTVISYEEIEKYYNENEKNFELKDYIVKVYYIKLEKNAPEIDNAKKWYQSDNEEDFVALEDYCHKYAKKYLLNPDKWIYLADLQKQIVNESIESLLKEKKTMEFEDEKYIHLLRIHDYKMKDSVSPLSLEEQNIKNIILNQRKLNLIKNMRNDIFLDALNKNKFEVYTN